MSLGWWAGLYGWGEPPHRPTGPRLQDTGPPHVNDCPTSGGCTHDQRRPHRQDPGPRRLAPPPARSGRREPRRLPVVVASDAPALGLGEQPQQRSQLLGDLVRIVGELAPGDADHAPPGDLQGAVLGPVALERRPRAVGGEAVALDDDAVLGPGGVELAVVAAAVDVRSRKAVGVQEGEEAALEEAGWDCRAVPSVVLEHASDRFGAGALRVSRDEGIEGGRAHEAADLRLVERGLELRS